MSMKVLVITNENPYPPTNGVTIPVYNYIKNLSRLHEVDTCLLGDFDGVESPFGDIFTLPCKSRASILNELRGEGCYFDLTPVDLDSLREIVSYKDYDLIIASPINCISTAVIFKELQHEKKPKLIGAISDCYTAVLRNKSDYSSLLDIKNTIVSRFRSCWMAKSENILLSKTDEVWVQSMSDLNWLRHTCKLSETIDIKIVTNGVEDALFDIDVDYNDYSKLKLAFVGSKTSLGHYKRQILWFYNKVWLKFIDEDQTDLKFIIKGGGINYSISPFSSIKSNDSIIVDQRFHANLVNVYDDFQILIAPVFKTYGFINKVGEAMAAGIVVVGDDSAFNAINFAEHGVNCFKCNTASEFIYVLRAIHAGKYDLNLIGSAAKKGAMLELDWKNKKLI